MTQNEELMELLMEVSLEIRHRTVRDTASYIHGVNARPEAHNPGTTEAQANCQAVSAAVLQAHLRLTELSALMAAVREHYAKVPAAWLQALIEAKRELETLRVREQAPTTERTQSGLYIPSVPPHWRAPDGKVGQAAVLERRIADLHEAIKYNDSTRLPHDMRMATIAQDLKKEPK